MDKKLEKILKDNGRSVTKQRQMVFDVLLTATKPLSTIELAKKLPGLDRVSVYRTIELYERIGLVHRIWQGFKSKVELSDAFSPHHHHFTCIQCGKTIGLKSDKLEKHLHDFEAEYNFQLTHHSVELSGYCGNCKSIAATVLDRASV